MSFLRNVVRDLVEKKLWPVAIVLLVALVAVPVVLGGGADAGSDTPEVAAVPTGPNGLADHRDVARAQVVSLEEQAAGKITRDGKTRNPFVQHHVPKAPKPDQAVSDALGTAKDLVGALTGGTGADKGSAPPSSGPTGGATTPPTAPTKPASPEATYYLTLSFGEAGAEKTYHNVARLTPLPSSTDPFFVFLGLKDDGKSAVFLVDGDAVPSGDGTCEPSEEACEQVVLQKGDIEFFELQSGTAGVVQYQLEVKDISKHKAATVAAAARSHARESRAGREYIRELVAGDPTALDAWDYSSKLGLLVSKEPEVANVPPAVADAAAGQTVQNTSTVLTVPAAPQP
jgi:hypothetical protein